MRPFGVALGRHIHIGHAQRLARMRDRQHVDRVRIGEAFERDAEGLLGDAPASALAALGARRAKATRISQKTRLSSANAGSLRISQTSQFGREA